MSSRFGPRARGTDGSDFHHRQKVAAHYRDSVTYKFRMKCVLLLHFLVFALVSGNLLEEFLGLFDIHWSKLERLELPKTEFWEWWWSASIVSILLALLGINHRLRITLGSRRRTCEKPRPRTESKLGSFV